MAHPGLLITLEGPEGGGKTTQLARLRRHLEADGYSVAVFHEPGGTPISNRIREVLLAPEHREMAAHAELFLFLAARAQLVEEAIRPAMATGHLVLCNRYTDSTLAYQHLASGLTAEQLESLNTIATGGLQPDLTLLLDVPAETGLARQVSRNRMEELGLDFHRRVREGYLALAARFPNRIVRIDASAPVDLVSQQIEAEVERFLDTRGVNPGPYAEAAP